MLTSLFTLRSSSSSSDSVLASLFNRSPPLKMFLLAWFSRLLILLADHSRPISFDNNVTKTGKVCRTQKYPSTVSATSSPFLLAGRLCLTLVVILSVLVFQCPVSVAGLSIADSARQPSAGIDGSIELNNHVHNGHLIMEPDRSRSKSEDSFPSALPSAISRSTSNHLHDSQQEVVIVDASGSSSSVPASGDHHSKSNPGYNYYATSNSHQAESHQHSDRFQVAKFDFDHVSTPYIISLWIIIVGLAKIGFHVTPKLSSVCPESVVLMVLGVIIGLIMYFAGIPDERLQPLTPNLFFLYMLPPIVMDAGYHMPNRLFFDNLVSILLYAVVGTIWNALAIGLSLYGCSRLGAFGEEIPFLDIMLFSSTVSAVDPVAVLAVFEEIHVNEVLYILVFGESLLNDGVTVVLYHMFEGYAEMAYHNGIESIQTIDYLAGVASFFVVALGGTIMGVVWGFLAAFVSRFTHHVKIIEPIFVFVMAYLSYLSAEMFHLSGILSLTFCGITMKNYVEENITQKSHTTLKYAMKMLANSSEAIIFVFLGVCTVNDQHRWNTAFVVLTIVFCLVYRTIGVIGLTAITNRFRLHRVNRVEQFIMSYGGLRGAVAFALILIINRQIIHAREMMVTTIIAVVYFTVFLQGMTVGALVNILNVPKANKFEMSMNERIHTRLMDHVMAGLEDISGMMMGNYKMRDKFRYYNNNYLRKWLLRDSKEMGNSSRKIFETCSRLDMQDAMKLVSNQQHLTTANNLALNRIVYNYSNSNLNHHHHHHGHNGDNNLDYDDKKNNNCANSSSSQSSSPKTIPNIFLTVPQTNGEGGQHLLDPNQSLTNLFRSYTQSNLSVLHNIDSKSKGGKSGSFLDSQSTDLEKDFNYDMGNIAYNPSLKDLKDAELHHILNDAMFKPFKKIGYYTRSDYSEPPPVHPPFQHQVRMQIRRLISQSEKRKRSHDDSKGDRKHKHRHRTSHSMGSADAKSRHSAGIELKYRGGSKETNLQTNEVTNVNNINLMDRGASMDDLLHRDNKEVEYQSADNGPNISVCNPSFEDDQDIRNKDDDDDAGIVFTAKKSPVEERVNKSETQQDTKADNDVFEMEPEPQSNETNMAHVRFPWRRTSSNSVTGAANEDSVSSGDIMGHIPNANKHHKLKDGVIRQREFPSWIDNREYVEDYASPTNTLLERINLLNREPNQSGFQSNTQNIIVGHVPSVYEVFHLDQGLEKGAQSKQAEMFEKRETSNKEKPTKTSTTEDTVIQFMSDEPPKDDHDDDQSIIISKL